MEIDKAKMLSFYVNNQQLNRKFSVSPHDARIGITSAATHAPVVNYCSRIFPDVSRITQYFLIALPAWHISAQHYCGSQQFSGTESAIAAIFYVCSASQRNQTVFSVVQVES